MSLAKRFIVHARGGWDCCVTARDASQSSRKSGVEYMIEASELENPNLAGGRKGLVAVRTPRVPDASSSLDALLADTKSIIDNVFATVGSLPSTGKAWHATSTPLVDAARCERVLCWLSSAGASTKHVNACAHRTLLSTACLHKNGACNAPPVLTCAQCLQHSKEGILWLIHTTLCTKGLKPPQLNNTKNS